MKMTMIQAPPCSAVPTGSASPNGIVPARLAITNPHRAHASRINLRACIDGPPVLPQRQCARCRGPARAKLADMLLGGPFAASDARGTQPPPGEPGSGPSPHRL
jgi:hypothetical protein